MNDTEYAEVVAKAERHNEVCNTLPPEKPAPALERAHHDYSPSTLQNLEACPCYRGKQSKNPHPRTVIGTLSHACIETGEDNAELSDGDIEKVAECRDFYNERKLAAGPGILELKETYLAIDDEEFQDVKSTSAGFIDCAIISQDRKYAECFDWKLGLWPVEPAKGNLQGIAYTLGLFRMFPTLQAVRFWFKQPNIDVLDNHLFKRSDIPELYLRVQVVVARAREARRKGDFSTARPMVPACNFCALIAQCPKVTAFACNVGSKFFPLEIPASITPTEVHNPHNTKLGLQLSAVLAVWATAFKSLVTERVLRQEVPVPEGFVIQSRSKREIVDETLFQKVARKFLSAKEYATTLSPAFGKTEKAISDKAPRGQKEATVEEFGKALEEAGAVNRGEPYVFLRAAPSKGK